MIITVQSPAVATLKQEWNSAEVVRNEEIAEVFKRRLVRDVFAPAVQEYSGELILTYHEFLKRIVVSHRFGYGFKTRAQTVYWVSVARITTGVVKEVPVVQAKNLLFFDTPSKVLVPVHSMCSLRPQYHETLSDPSFVFWKDGQETALDIAFFGHGLFNIWGRDYLYRSWNEIAIGNESVKEWLQGRNSADTFDELMRR